MRRIVIAATLVMAIAGAAQAELYNVNGTDVEVEYWSSEDALIDLGSWGGSAESSAMLVVDFGASSYAFGYLWDGSATGEDMLASTAAAGSFEYDYTSYSFGIGVDAMRYDGNSMLGFAGYPTDWMGYWLSPDGIDWTVSGVGVSGRDLVDGAWDGWAHEFDDELGDYMAEDPPTTPVPEPGTILLTGLGIALIGIRRLKAGRTEA